MKWTEGIFALKFETVLYCTTEAGFPFTRYKNCHFDIEHDSKLDIKIGCEIFKPNLARWYALNRSIYLIFFPHFVLWRNTGLACKRTHCTWYSPTMKVAISFFFHLKWRNGPRDSHMMKAIKISLLSLKNGSTMMLENRLIFVIGK